MRLSISFAVKDRVFGKAMRRIRPCFDSLCSEFEALKLDNPIHEIFLLGVTDDLPDCEFREVKNKDGFFQVMCGFDQNASFLQANDEALKLMLFQKIFGAVKLCPFSAPDRQSLNNMLSGWASNKLPSHEQSS